MQWFRKLDSAAFHAISSVVYGGNVTGRCRVQWPERDAVESSDSPPIDECCVDCVREIVRVGGCDVAWTGLSKLAVGLAEARP